MKKIGLITIIKTVFKNLIKSMNKTETLELKKACSAI